jgi:zinc/manganese transport system ATP-binding protein
MSPRPQPAITFNDLTLGYDRHPAVHHITGEVAKGELLAIVGPNGAGKSTLLKGIVGELKPLGGSLKLDSFTKSDIAYLPQQIEIDRSFPISVFDCVAMGLWREIGAWRGLAGAGKSHVASALATVGLQDLGDRSVGALSGASSSVCCSRGSCCRTHPSSCSTSRSAPSTREPSPTSSLSS